MHIRDKRQFNNQKGQALLFVVVGMTVALAVGISVALRTISTTSRVATTDTAARVLAAAEGGLEKFLSYPLIGPGLSLENLAQPGMCDGNYSDTPPPECVVGFAPLSDDNVEAHAVMIVESYGDVSPYIFRVAENTVSEIHLSTYGSSDVRVCWEGTSSDLHYVVYGDSGLLNGLVCPTGGCASGNPSGETTANSGSGSCPADVDDNTFVINNLGSVGGLMGLRILSLGDVSTVAVLAQGGSLGFPVQGYRITAIGELNEHGMVQATRTISVRRSLPYLPAIFDFGIYAEGGIN